MNKYFAALLLCCFLMLAACTGNDADDDAQPVATTQQNTLSVVWMRSPADPPEQLQLIQQFADDFEASHDATVTVTLVDWGEGREEILKMVEAGTPPDLAVIGARWVPEFVSLGLIEPLDRFITHDFRQQFIPSIIDEGAVYQGRTFGLPVATSTRALFYNQALLEAAGYEQPPATWDQLLEVSQAINDLEGDAYGFGLQGGAGGLETNTYFYYFVWGNGGDLYNDSRTTSALDSQEAVDALAFLHRMIEADATQPDPTADAYARRRGVEDLFLQGQLGMVISGPWFIGTLRSQSPEISFGIAPIPYNTTPATYGVIDTLVMFSTSSNKALAWDYLEYLYTPERRLAYTQVAGVLPEMTAVAAAPEFAEDPDYAVFLSLLPDARFEPLHSESEQISEEVVTAVRQVYLGEAEPQAALSEAARSINALLSTSVAGW